MTADGVRRASARIRRRLRRRRLLASIDRLPPPHAAPVRRGVPMIRYDLHAHSTFSDGLLTPAALVERAAARGVDVLALTDHDETVGIADAARRRVPPASRSSPARSCR